MDINELESYNLKDAVRFHNKLNPRLWGRDEHLLPEVREALLSIADDFREFLGVQDLEVKDITVSGSNAAYSYTPHSDIDLHLVVEIPESSDEIYRELFNAKKFQYNEQHNLKVRQADVELYVQPSDEPHVSQGIYSVKDNKWIDVPKRKRARIDDSSVRHKYEDLVARIHQAVQGGDTKTINALIDKIKNMRQSGLDQHGEFGADNLAFKILRTQGLIKKLYDARTAAQDRELSLKERDRQVERVRYGYTTVTNEAPYSTPDGVAPTTCMFLNEQPAPADVLKDFYKYCCRALKIKNPPRLRLHRDPEWSRRNATFGQYMEHQHELHISATGRHIMDMLRTLAHELTHARQHEVQDVPDHAGDTGSPWEDDANAMAGRLMRHYGRAHPELFDQGVNEGASGYIPNNANKNDPRYKMALTVDIRPNEVQKQARRMGFKTSAAGIPPTLSTNGLAYKVIKENRKGTDESWGILAEEDLFEVNMSPGNLKKMAAATGAKAGIEFEMYVPNAAEEDEYGPEPENDYDMDESFPTGRGWQREVIEFFRGGDYGSTTSTIQRALDHLDEDYWTWKDENFEEWYDNNSVVFMEYLQAELPQDDDEDDEEYAERLRTVAAETGGAEYERAMDQFREEYQGEDQWEEFLSDIDISTMQDFGNRESLDWPYVYSNSNSGGSISIDDVASDFQSAIGRRVTTGGYHSGQGSQTNNYRVETDSSLDEPDNPEDGGLEFISPPLPIDQMLSDLDKVIKWANRNACYTNNTTGLHINVSVPDFSKDKLDYVKLAIFLGDEYVLEQFGRLGNSYCQSAMQGIKEIARKNPSKMVDMLEKMQNNLSAMASKIVHTGETNKYTSINTQDGYIEFRSPGGDWLGEYAADKDKINNTLLRFTVALDIAMKPELYRQEYMKKLYKVLTPTEFNKSEKGVQQTAQSKDISEVTDLLSKYLSGNLPKSAMKSFVKQMKLQRQAQKLPPGENPASEGKPWLTWKVTGPRGARTIVARTEDEARKKGGIILGVSLLGNDYITMRVEPEDLYRGKFKEYKIFSDHNNNYLDSAEGADEADAIANFRINAPHWNNYDITAKLHTPSVPQQSQTASSDQEFTGTWEVVSRPTDEVVYTISGIGNAVQDAERHAARWAEETGFSDPVYVRPRMRPRTTGGGFDRAPHTSIYQLVDNRDGRILLGGETRTFAYTVEMANLSRFDGVPSGDIRIIDMATNRSYNIDGLPVNASAAPVAPVPGSTLDRAQQRFTVDYTIRQYGDVMNNRVTVPAANADAAMDNVRNQLEASRAEVLRIEAEPIEQAQARGTESLPSGTARWLILDRNGSEIYSFINTTAQSDANQYARDWLSRNRETVGQLGPFDIVPSR